MSLSWSSAGGGASERRHVEQRVDRCTHGARTVRVVCLSASVLAGAQRRLPSTHRASSSRAARAVDRRGE
jgi:hypothetical protein